MSSHSGVFPGCRAAPSPASLESMACPGHSLQLESHRTTVPRFQAVQQWEHHLTCANLIFFLL